MLQLSRFSLSLILASSLSPALLAQSESALFDGQAEGSLGSTYIEDGIIFSELDRYLGSSNESFTADDASASLAGLSGFSAPNALGFGGFAPGPSVAFTRCGSFKITPPGVRDAGEVSLFVAGGGNGNVVTLEALMGANVVASDMIALPSGFAVPITLSVSGVSFDRLRLVGTGPANSGAFFAVVDGVHFSAQGGLGTNYCGPAVVNSTGQPGMISAAGSVLAVDNDVTLTCSQMPQDQFAFFLNSLTQGFVANPGASQGNLCLVGSIGRYNANILNSGAIGEVSLTLDLPNTPIPTGIVAIMAGETWNFQCWHRDLNPQPTSNFSDGLSITFQ